MQCTACGAESAENARFCGSCGAPLPLRCAGCGEPLADGVRFCTGCGLQVAAGGPGPSSASGEGSPAERRRISVLFVDLEDFTTIAESLDPEEVRRVQSRYFEVARSVIAGHDGTIEKFIGDAVMAIWGAPAGHEDDAERAVRAALAVVDQVSRLGGAVAERRLTARAGVASGEAAVTVGAVGQGMVSGDLVNIAARLQPMAPSGGVLVDAATRELAPAAATYESLGMVSLKGRSGPIAVFRAGAPSAVTGRVRGAHGGPFVGRDRELGELITLYETVARDHQSRLVSVTGIAGIGKSRLAWEFGAWVDELPEAVAWHVGRAPAYGEGITFAALAEMVRRRIRVADDAPPGVALRQLEASLEELVRDEEERRWMAARVAVLLGPDTDHAFDRDDLFAAWRRFFERVADRSPTVLVFEDLHWADPALLDFVEHLATWSRSHRIMVVTLARPELLDRRPGFGGSVGRFTSLHLERLSDEAMRELLLGRATSLPEQEIRSILDRAGGVPLYAVEVARVLEDRDQEMAGPAVTERLDVPDSLAGLIVARIDALPVDERRLLLSAAVLGRSFRPEALHAVSGSDATLVRVRVEDLVRRDLLQIDDELASPGLGGLSFVQDLVRDVAYRTLGLTDRRALHIAAARYLESREDEGAAEALAYHLLKAHELAPDHPDAVRVARRAVGALRTAAGDALRMHAPERALADLQQALDLVDSPEQRAFLLEEAATSARAAARLDVAESYLRELVALVTPLDPERAARGRAKLASVLLTAQRNESALVELEAALSAMKDPDSDPAGVEVAAQLARAHVLVGDDAASLAWAERAASAAQRLGMDAVAIDAVVTRGTARVRLGDEAAGMSDLDMAIERARSGAFLSTELRARNNLAWLTVADDPRATLRTARDGFELATKMGVGDMAAQLGEVACAAAFDTGDWSWALATTDDILRGSVPDANRISLIAGAAIIGAITGDDGRIAALDDLEPLPAATDAQLISGVQHARAWIAFVAGEFAVAAGLAADAAAGTFGAERVHQLALGARAAMWDGDRASAAHAMAEIDREPLRGRTVAATRLSLEAGLAALETGVGVAAFARADEAWRALDLPVHLALSRLDADRLLGDAAPPPDELITTLEGLGAHGLLRLVEVAPIG
ncbi:MAG TPA: AAA family ATPase [Candidatus Limnocylindria bacterium]